MKTSKSTEEGKDAKSAEDKTESKATTKPKAKTTKAKPKTTTSKTKATPAKTKSSAKAKAKAVETKVEALESKVEALASKVEEVESKVEIQVENAASEAKDDKQKIVESLLKHTIFSDQQIATMKNVELDYVLAIKKEIGN